MRYMLDTNICIYIIKNKPRQVFQRLKEHDMSDVCISSVTYAELAYGCEKSAYADRNRVALKLFLAGIEILPFDIDAGEEYGRVRAGLERKGISIGSADMMIAAHAIAEDCTVVTNNTGEFVRVEGLKVENWV